jgi:glutathione synthase/RimK-type ligase-like ATP-grasp enzyme
MSKLILKVVYLFVLFSKINFLKIFKLNKKGSKNVIWIYQSYPKEFFRYIRGNSFLNDMALINAFITKGEEFELIIGPRIDKKSSRNIYYTISKEFNLFHLPNHSSMILCIVEELENQGNTLFPSLHELIFWENKSYMHKQFDLLGINTPKTVVVESKLQFDSIKSSLEFPCLMKECNSAGSLGIYKVNSLNELDSLVDTKMKQGMYEFLIQSLIDMRKDIRVTIVGEEIVLHYWRLNQEKEWKPTSTGHGSKVDFISFPEQWRNDLVLSMKRLGLRTGAFDVTWQGDELSTKPIILEVSPAYMPNPPIPSKFKDISYASYKKKLTFSKSYPTEYIKLVFEIKQKVVNLYLNEPK